MYKLNHSLGDSLAVPRLVFSKLTATGADDARFRVALYIISQQQAQPADIAEALHLSKSRVDQALQYWEGAGLLERQAVRAAAPVEKPARQYMSAKQVAVHAGDPTLAAVITETQRILGKALSPTDISVLATLCLADEIPAGVILMAAMHCREIYKQCTAKSIEKKIFAWQSDGLCDVESVDAHLKLLAKREERLAKLAKEMGVPKDSFTLAECRRITQWYEEYGYNKAMIEAARLAAGEMQNEVKYLHAILKKWHGKGYKTPKDLQQEGPQNVQAKRRKGVAPEDDLMLNTYEYKPRKKRRQA